MALGGKSRILRRPLAQLDGALEIVGRDVAYSPEIVKPSIRHRRAIHDASLTRQRRLVSLDRTNGRQTPQRLDMFGLLAQAPRAAAPPVGRAPDQPLVLSPLAACPIP